MTTYAELADLLFPDVKLLPKDILAMYPLRKIDKSAKVTRFAPSPTGFITIGSLYATFISERLAHQTNGVFYLRIEDTDKKREVKGSIADMIQSLNHFGIVIDEGPTIIHESGNYGPYTQSARVPLYHVFIKDLIKKGLAYPCFCETEDLKTIRDNQQSQKVITGYYGAWAFHRNFTLIQVASEIVGRKPFVIRLKSPGHSTGKIIYRDLVKGEIQMPENDQDIVIMKSDGVPTYHFAHVIDDFLMGTTHVIRGDEWISSVPIHLQLFEVLGFNKPEYGHIAPIMKMDGSSKRKFSKRKDLDAAAKYYIQEGYPSEVVNEYFMHLINSSFEEWRISHPTEPYINYHIDVSKMNVSGALFDLNKLNDISKDVISRLCASEVYAQVLCWAKEFDGEFYEMLSKDQEYSESIFNIGRLSDKPRKDFTKWSEVKSVYTYFFDDLFNNRDEPNCDLPSTVPLNIAKLLVHAFSAIYDSNDDREQWFGKVKDIAERFGYAREMKLFKKNPENYRGHIGDVATVLRIVISNRINTPDLYDIIQVMQAKRIQYRLSKFASEEPKLKSNNI